MGKNQSASGLTNIVQYDTAGNISLVSGSTTLLYISSSGAITTRGVISGSNALSASYAVSASNALAAVTASFVQNAQSASYVLIAQTASFVATAQTASFVANAQSASNAIAAQTASYANSFTVAGTLTAQTLVVQTITSSVDFVTGSTRFGSIADNTHQFTGSVNVTGSTNLAGSLKANKIGINVGDLNLNNFTTFGLIVSGSIGFGNSGGAAVLVDRDGSGNTTFYGGIGDINFTDITMTSNYLTIKNAGNVGIGTANPSYRLHVSGAFSSNPGLYVYGTAYGMIGVDRGGAAASAGVNYYTTGSQRWFTGIYENTNNFGFYNALSANFPMVITTGSRVGIGTTNPSHPLHVASSTVYQILAEQTSTDTNNTGAYATFYAVNNAGSSQVRGLFGAGGNSVSNTALRNAVYYGAQSDHSVVFMANDAERMRITNGGDITIAGTGAMKIHSGTTGQRPTAATGQIRYNTSFNFLEYYDGSNWVPVVGQTSPGSSASNPAESANEIKTYNPNATNGLYWIRQVGTTPVQAYCVFTDYNGSAIQGGPWTVPIISNDANTNFSDNGPTAAAQFLSKCQAIGIASPGRGMENTRTTTEVYGAWLAVKRALWNNYSTFITNGTTGGGAVLRMPMININGAGGASDQRLVYNTSLGTHLPPNIDGDACNASQLFCGWWAGTDISGWRVNDNAIPGSEDWNPSDTVNGSYNGNGLQSALTVCVYK